MRVELAASRSPTRRTGAMASKTVTRFLTSVCSRAPSGPGAGQGHVEVGRALHLAEHRGRVEGFDVLGQPEDGAHGDARALGDLLGCRRLVARLDQIEQGVDRPLVGVEAPTGAAVGDVGRGDLLGAPGGQRRHPPIVINWHGKCQYVVTVLRRWWRRVGLRLGPGSGRHSLASIRRRSSSRSSISSTSEREPLRRAVGRQQPLGVVGADRGRAAQLPRREFGVSSPVRASARAPGAGHPRARTAAARARRTRRARRRGAVRGPAARGTGSRSWTRASG